jgi:dCMP deaminase
MSDWDGRMMGLAKHVAQWSKDPSTKVGCVITDEKHRVISVGFNGFPRGIPDAGLQDREYKYARVVHAELNALMFARGSVEGCTMYVWPMPPCSRCAGPIIQAGITRVVSPPPGERWQEACAVGEQMFRQAWIEVSEVDDEG